MRFNLSAKIVNEKRNEKEQKKEKQEAKNNPGEITIYAWWD
jgi:hypothetical protein